MDSDLEARIAKLEHQVATLAYLVYELLDLLRNAALEPWQMQERGRCEQLMQTVRTIKPSPKR